MPLLLLGACLVPCLVPLALLRRKESGATRTTSPAVQQAQ
jgi:hypothetical protein